MFTPLNSLRALILVLAQAITFGVNVATLRKKEMNVGDLVRRKQFSPHEPIDSDLFIVLKVVRQGVRATGRLWKVAEPFSGISAYPLVELRYFEQV